MERVSGYDILRNPKLNKGTAFSMEEREKYNLIGLLPEAIETIDNQVERVLNQISRLNKPINKYIFLMQLLENNERLFFKTVSTAPKKFLPIVYTPTVGEACQHFGQVSRRPEECIFQLSKKIISKKLLKIGLKRMCVSLL
ncbi:hypothetical protein [Flavobacterium sp. LM5]|uniref:hypothetical protein n=1 Tax=Flavobacterium sp. LM5 TaxID=1938610 RepID=UPI0021010A44|nr:hypothetical protein [Flavobacterium sp. LM5]